MTNNERCITCGKVCNNPAHRPVKETFLPRNSWGKSPKGFGFLPYGYIDSNGREIGDWLETVQKKLKKEFLSKSKD